MTRIPKYSKPKKTITGKVLGGGRRGTVREFLRRHVSLDGHINFADQPEIRRHVLSKAEKGTATKRVNIDTVIGKNGIEHRGFMDSVKGRGKVIVIELMNFAPEYRRSAQILDSRGRTIGWVSRNEITTANRWNEWKKANLENHKA